MASSEWARPEALRQRRAGDPDEVPDAVEGDRGGGFVVSEAVREAEEVPLAGGQAREGLPRRGGSGSHRPQRVRRPDAIEEHPQSGQRGRGGEEGQARLRPARLRDLEGGDPREVVRHRLSERGRDPPLHPRDVLAAAGVRGQDFEPLEAVPPLERARLPADGLGPLEGAPPPDANKQGGDAGPEDERLEDLDGLVVAEEPRRHDPEVLEKAEGHGDLDAFHGPRLTGKPFRLIAPRLLFPRDMTNR